jgi:hypothetical protein
MFYVGSTAYGLMSDHISRSIEEWLPDMLGSNTLPTHVNAFTYEDQKIGSPWAMTVRGKDTLTGTVKARDATGLIHGYFRNGTITLHYANADIMGPGYGDYFLRRVSNITGVAWVGTVVFHDCDEVNGIQCESNRLNACPVMSLKRRAWTPFFRLGISRVVAIDRWVRSTLSPVYLHRKSLITTTDTPEIEWTRFGMTVR